MEKIVVATFNLRGTEKEIERVRGIISSLSVLEEVMSMHIRTSKKEEMRSEKEERAEALFKFGEPCRTTPSDDKEEEEIRNKRFQERWNGY